MPVINSQLNNQAAFRTFGLMSTGNQAVDTVIGGNPALMGTTAPTASLTQAQPAVTSPNDLNLVATVFSLLGSLFSMIPQLNQGGSALVDPARSNMMNQLGELFTSMGQMLTNIMGAGGVTANPANVPAGIPLAEMSVAQRQQASGLSQMETSFNHAFGNTLIRAGSENFAATERQLTLEAAQQGLLMQGFTQQQVATLTPEALTPDVLNQALAGVNLMDNNSVNVRDMKARLTAARDNPNWMTGVPQVQLFLNSMDSLAGLSPNDPQSHTARFGADIANQVAANANTGQVVKITAEFGSDEFFNQIEAASGNSVFAVAAFAEWSHSAYMNQGEITDNQFLMAELGLTQGQGAYTDANALLGKLGASDLDMSNANAQSFATEAVLNSLAGRGPSLNEQMIKDEIVRLKHANNTNHNAIDSVLNNSRQAMQATLDGMLQSVPAAFQDAAQNAAANGIGGVMDAALAVGCPWAAGLSASVKANVMNPS